MSEIEYVTKQEFLVFQAQVWERYNECFSALATGTSSAANQQGSLQACEIVLSECVAIWATDPGARRVLQSLVEQCEKQLRTMDVGEAYLEGAMRLLNRVRDALKPRQ